MRGRWAGVSGYIESSEAPIERAFKEIEEETGLTSEDIQFTNAALPLEVADIMNPNCITWVVHPFFFHSNRGTIKLDWEHDKYVWIEPQDIGKYDVVPRLKDVLDSLSSSNFGSKLKM